MTTPFVPEEETVEPEFAEEEGVPGADIEALLSEVFPGADQNAPSR